MEPAAEVANLADLLNSRHALTATAYPDFPSSATSHPPPLQWLPNDRTVLSVLHRPTVIVGTLILPNPTGRSCFQFSDGSATVCCDLLQFQPGAIGKRLRVTAWNFIPSKNHERSGRCGFLEIIKWCFLDSDEGSKGLNHTDSLPLMPNHLHNNGQGNIKEACFRVYGVVESVGPVSSVSWTLAESPTELNSRSIARMEGFVAQLKCCECSLCRSNELLNDLESGNGHSFTKKETVYFCDGTSHWHPAMTKLIGNRIMLSRLKKKLIFIGKEGSRELHLTAAVSVLHVCRVSKKWLPCLKSDVKLKGECGSYSGVIKGFYMQGMALELDHDVWLLLTHELHTRMHGLRVGAVITVRNVHFVNPHFSWTKIVILGACVRTSITVESFSPLDTACNVILKSPSMLGKFIQSLPFSARLWVLLLVSSLRKKFAGILSDKEILGSQHEEGLAQKYASSLFPPSEFQKDYGSFMGLHRHDSNGCSRELHCNFPKLVIPISVSICHCINILLRRLKSENHCKSLPVGNHFILLSCEARHNGRSVRRIIPSADIGIVLLGYLKINPSTGRLQLVDATGGIDVLIPDLPLTWNAEKIYEVTDYDIVVDCIGKLEDHFELFECEALSCKSIFNCSLASRNLSNSVFVYFHWKKAKCIPFPLYHYIDKNNESAVPEPGSYHLLRVSHKFPLLEKFSNNTQSSAFVEAKSLPFLLLLTGKSGASDSYNVSRDKTNKLSEYCISGNNGEQGSNKRQKLVKESVSSLKDETFTAIHELRACSNSFKKSKPEQKCVDLSSSNDISCLVTFGSCQHESVVCPAVLHLTSPTEDVSFNSKPNARKVLLEFSSDRFLTYQSLKIGDCYIIKHNSKDCICTTKNAGFGGSAKLLVGSGKHLFSLSFNSDEILLNYESECTSEKDSFSPSIDRILTKDEIERFLLRSNVDSSCVYSDVSLYLPMNSIGLLKDYTMESVDAQSQEFVVSEVSTDVTLSSGIVLGRPTFCSWSQNSEGVFPVGKLISLKGDIIDIHDIGSSFSNSCSSGACLDSLQLKGLNGTRSSFCIHVLVHHHIVKIFASISKHAFPMGFGSGVTAKFHRILDLREENKFMLLPVSFIEIKSIKGLDKQSSDWSSNLSPNQDAHNASPDSISCLIAQLHQCPRNKQIKLRCRVTSVIVLVLERKTTNFDAQTRINDRGTVLDIPIAGFLLDDGSSICCCWANAERVATMLRLHEDLTTSYNLGRILNNYEKIIVKNHGSFIDSPYQDLAISVTSGNGLCSVYENLLKSIIFNANVGRIWNVVGSVMDVDEVRHMEKEYPTEMVNFKTMQNIWATEVSWPLPLAEAKKIAQELLRS